MVQGSRRFVGAEFSYISVDLFLRDVGELLRLLWVVVIWGDLWVLWWFSEKAFIERFALLLVSSYSLFIPKLILCFESRNSRLASVRGR